MLSPTGLQTALSLPSQSTPLCSTKLQVSCCLLLPVPADSLHLSSLGRQRACSILPFSRGGRLLAAHLLAAQVPDANGTPERPIIVSPPPCRT